MKSKKSENTKEYQRIWYQEHKKERAAYARERRASNKVYHANWQLKNYYGIDLKDWEALYAKQGLRCAICPAIENKNGRRLCVDHDHDTGRVRGLLCNRCNRALGLFRDSPTIMKKALLYLLREKYDE